ncbi:hypothetical protein [Weissella confusa]|uniref:hypothetical protein n=1 Tax=Weissella confusa TaxID=1583 RepID=UPI0018F1A92C|nr:hypothetical protein [Weissella confusa]MBJ7625200.1 hypothetical protein [Weissella confusa]MBJ7676343.1 hypothetical protein [Weissella confusa]
MAEMIRIETDVLDNTGEAVPLYVYQTVSLLGERVAITDGGYFIEDLLNAKGQDRLCDDIRRIQQLLKGTPMTFDMRNQSLQLKCSIKKADANITLATKVLKRLRNATK